MRIPRRLRQLKPHQKLLASATIALTATFLAMGLTHLPWLHPATARIDDAFYTAFYHLRPAEDQSDRDVIIIAVDDKSLDAMNRPKKSPDDAEPFGWPWPRSYWGILIDHLDRSGASAVGFDLLFSETSGHQNELGDDQALAESADKARVPVVFATTAGPDGQPGPFAPPVKHRRLGAVNLFETVDFVSYKSRIGGVDSLALSCVKSAGLEAREIPASAFRLHYFGPHLRGDGGHTFRYVSASDVLRPLLLADDPATARHIIPPDFFKGKIVLIGAIASGTYDLKTSPVSKVYPGVEVHATAIEDFLGGRYVREIGLAGTATASLLAAWAAAAASLLPRRVAWKLALPLATLIAVVTGGALLFRGHQINYLPMTAPLLAGAAAVVAGMAWSYLAEGRQRRFILKALSQYVSKSVAQQIERDPSRLQLGGQRRTMTVMFSDVAGFTDLSESLEVEDLTQLLNYYFGEMSAVILGADGTLDKYIGDGIMSFWNAPVDQADHALSACRTALGMVRREREVAGEFARYGPRKIYTRIGINTGAMAVGNYGSDERLSYTVVGDAVNLASRLEGANKFYGTQVMLADSTAELVKDHCRVRHLDLLRVKGKLKPLGVFELMDDHLDNPLLADVASRYEAGLAHYQAMRWDQAQATWLDLLKVAPEDGPARVMLERIKHFRDEPPPADWDGVYVAKGK